MKRTSLREQIFKILFRVEFNTPDEMPAQEELFFDAGDIEVTDEDRAYITDKTNRIIKKIPELDKVLSEHMTGWTLDRIGRAELTILRLGAYEILFDEDIPDKVAISEAVELAKRFGSDNAASFVNGVLAKIVPGSEMRKKPENRKTSVAARKKEEASGAVIRVVSAKNTESRKK